ncbi:MAG: hypothetical protein AAGE94_13775 [Acidobacteriota bacterium]
MKTWIAVVWRLVTDDLRRLAVPVGLWLALLAATGVTVWPRTGVVYLNDVKNLDLLRILLGFAGPFLAGLFVLIHPIDRRAFWYTRPWTRGHIVAAKVIEVLVFVWLPAAVLQASVLVELDRFELPWLALTADFALTPGAWILGGAALGVLVRSVESWLVAAFVSAMASSWVWTSFPVSGQLVDPWRLAGLAVTALAVSAVAYRTLDRLMASGLAVVLLVGLAVGSVLVPDPGSALSKPALFPIHVSSIAPPTDKGQGAPPGCHSLCADLTVTLVPDIEPLTFQVEGVATGDDGSTWSRQSRHTMGRVHEGRPLGPKRWALDAQAFGEVCGERFERERDSSARVAIDVKALGLNRELLADGRLRQGEVLAIASDRYVSSGFRINRIERYGSRIWVETEALFLGRASASHESLLVDPALLIGRERLKPIHRDLEFGGRFRPIKVLPFRTHRIFEQGQTWTFDVGDRPGEPRLLLEAVDWAEIGSGSVTWDDVTLGDLACDPKQRNPSTTVEGP